VRRGTDLLLRELITCIEPLIWRPDVRVFLALGWGCELASANWPRMNIAESGYWAHSPTKKFSTEEHLGNGAAMG